MQIKLVASVMIVLLFGFSGQYVSNLAFADDSWSDIQKNAAISEARAMQKYSNTHVLSLDQSTNYAGLTNTPTDQTVYNPRASNIAFGEKYAAEKGITIFGQIHALGLDKFSTNYSSLRDVTTDQSVKMDRNVQIALAQASLYQNNVHIKQAMANVGQNYVGINNVQTTDTNGRDRNAMIQAGIAELEQRNEGLIAQLAGLSTNYAGLNSSVTTDTNGRDRNADIAAGKIKIDQQLEGCYTADHPSTCYIAGNVMYVPK